MAPDPTARDEGRYDVAGIPTNRCAKRKAESTDPVGREMLPDDVEMPMARSRSLDVAATGAVTVIIVMVAAVVWVTGCQVVGQRRRRNRGYLAALKDAGVATQFQTLMPMPSPTAGRCVESWKMAGLNKACWPTIAVDAFPPVIRPGSSHLLETVTVSGDFRPDRQRWRGKRDRIKTGHPAREPTDTPTSVDTPLSP